MRLLPTLGLALYPLLSGCASSGATHDAVEVVEADPAVRAPLMAAVAGLAGRWTVLGEAGEDTGTTEFTVTSMGSAVREVMFVGAPHEMTNLYTLDGNTLHMTHYCGAGNQPHMRATKVTGDRLEFAPAGVSDLEAPNETYMGQLTLVFVDADHVEQHWQGFGADAHATVIKLRRLSR